MTFQERVSNWWQRHAAETTTVASEVTASIQHRESKLAEAEISACARLIVHLFGVHLGQFEPARRLLNELSQQIQSAESRTFLDLQLATLDLSEKDDYKKNKFSLVDQIKIYAGAVQIHVGLRQVAAAKKKYQLAINLLGFLENENSNSDDKTAFRAMAIASNNLACQFEEQAELSAEETELMLEAAHKARDFWGKAGAWLEIERAEYRLARSYLKAGNNQASVHHAALCLEICTAHQAEPLEFFFAYQALLMAEPNRVEEQQQVMRYFNLLSEGDQAWCQAELDQLKLRKY